MNKMIQVATSLLNEIRSLSERGLLFLQQDRLDEFYKVIRIRDQKLKIFNQLREDINQMQKAFLSPEENAEINKKFKLKIEKLTKVDKKILDTINSKMEEIMEKVDQVNKGKSFLKAYKKHVNSRRTFQRII